jgi:putative membrane protein
VISLLRVLCVFIALQHVAFLVLEMFLWRRPAGMKVFRTTPEFAKQSAALAANQGLYNGFLAAGLLWGSFHSAPDQALEIQVFFLVCVVVAGIFGAATVSRRIFWVQAVPALVALGIAWLR